MRDLNELFGYIVASVQSVPGWRENDNGRTIALAHGVRAARNDSLSEAQIHAVSVNNSPRWWLDLYSLTEWPIALTQAREIYAQMAHHEDDDQRSWTLIAFLEKVGDAEDVAAIQAFIDEETDEIHAHSARGNASQHLTYWLASQGRIEEAYERLNAFLAIATGCVHISEGAVRPYEPRFLASTGRLDEARTMAQSFSHHVGRAEAFADIFGESDEQRDIRTARDNLETLEAEEPTWGTLYLWLRLFERSGDRYDIAHAHSRVDRTAEFLSFLPGDAVKERVHIYAATGADEDLGQAVEAFEGLEPDPFSYVEAGGKLALGLAQHS